MGKAQSKRSVDITTETKKGTEEEVTEKMGKIEDLDKKEVVNGDATISEKSEQEKKEEDMENDKDITTEKDVDVQASGDSADAQNTGETLKEEGGPATAEEEISPLADESIKKSKKEKVKKKWSFRSISFGKKDKLKPAKSEEVAEDGSAAINGADTNEKTNESEDSKKDKSNENEEKTTDAHENGNATPQELNEQNGEKPSDDNITANVTTIEKACEHTVQNETAAVSSELSEKTENTTVINETKTSGNATVDDASKNGNGVDEKRNASDQEPQKPGGDTNASVEASEKTSLLTNAAINDTSATTNGEVVDQIHQNGDHGESDQAVIEKSKAQIEVNFNTDNNVVSAATLDSLSSTSISPSNVQTHVQDLNASSEVPDEIVQINNVQPVVESSTDTDITSIQTVCPSANNEFVVSSTVLEVTDENVAQVAEEVSDASSPSSKTVETSFPEKLLVDSPPPPLPISPPPSQVSVFAFTNNEDTIPTKNIESLNNLIEGEEEKKTEMPLPPSSNLPSTEIDSSQEIGSPTIPIESETFNENTISSEEPAVQHLEDEVNVEINKCQENKVVVDDEEEEGANLCKDLNTTDTPEQSIEIDDEEAISVTLAATVIEEITETAAEIVNQHLKSDNEQITDEKITCQDEINNENIIENYIEDKTQSDKVSDDQDLLKCDEDGQESEQLPPPVIEQTNCKTIECSLDLTASNSIMQQNEEETISLNKSNNFDELHLDPTKEFATAKDIKDNVTVAEITQDLSVTCE